MLTRRTDARENSRPSKIEAVSSLDSIQDAMKRNRNGTNRNDRNVSRLHAGSRNLFFIARNHAKMDTNVESEITARCRRLPYLEVFRGSQRGDSLTIHRGSGIKG